MPLIASDGIHVTDVIDDSMRMCCLPSVALASVTRKAAHVRTRFLLDERRLMHTIDSTIQLGETVEHRGAVIAPLFPRVSPRAAYVTLEEALALGFRVTEVDAAGSVPELLAVNPLDADVLLYEGEELLGAKQNRILNVTVLAASRSETRIPVSCVEEG